MATATEPPSTEENDGDAFESKVLARLDGLPWSRSHWGGTHRHGIVVGRRVASEMPSARV